MKLKNKWRVVSTEGGYYNVQKKYWWFPFIWLTARIGSEATYYPTVEKALTAIKKDCDLENTPKFKPKVVATYESES